MNKQHYLFCAAFLVFVLVLSSCTSVGPLTYRLAHNPPPVLVNVRHERGMRVETWHISGKPYSKAYIKGGKKVKEEIFTEDGRLYAEDTILSDGMEIGKIFDEQGRLQVRTKNVPGSPEWHSSEVYNPDGSVKFGGKWYPLISPSEARAAGIYELIEGGFDRIPPGGVVKIPSQPQR